MQRPFAGEAHHQENEAVFGDLVGIVGIATVLEFNPRKVAG